MVVDYKLDSVFEKDKLCSTWKTYDGIYIKFNFEGLEPVNRRKLKKIKERDDKYVGFQLRGRKGIIRNFNSLSLVTLLGLEDYVSKVLNDDAKTIYKERLGGVVSEERIKDRLDKKKMSTYFQLIKISEDRYKFIVGDNQYKDCGMFKTVEYELEVNRDDLINLLRILKFFNYNKELDVQN